ncbi:TA system VapC family ribonuclease toxin [Mycolicibacterium brumae]|uniref:Ribonuclease VapC n=1 Tax=Mycolicibacterium brumae TaxID=85968 RepID=A0A2G5PE00_9MYCO|nr:TA system VapC family ribonuclease toxin [Mycolicibacterium brumae]MCV7193558.1 PIN domain-containing protein [Mycolicibacterium brumae]PIB76134.1 VapC toxin family PIN domain ribonuclease [Mycolicibacterium brumae]RWA17257.1 hypothetical protein MBRU_06445 [Mycolicibacterium brumae DSM 44177]UWW09170.1 PIN domain-containing protein [Mycolicibacterium brumae]
MTTLLDSNVLIALAVAEHVHHDAASEWLGSSTEHFSTCPITQGSLMRFLLRAGHTAATARSVIAGFERDRRHVFWPDDLGFSAVRLDGVIGHRQVTDAYLAELARCHSGRLATLDAGLASLHSDVADLIAPS